MHKYINLIKQNELFTDVKENFIDDCISKGEGFVSSYRKNSIIHFEGEISNVLDIILTGDLVIQRIDENGNILTITEFAAGSSIGGNLLFSRHPYYPMTIIAKTDTTIFHVKKDLILNLCQSNREFLYKFLISISDKTSVLTEKIKAISMKSIRESIIDYLKYEYHSQGSKRILLKMTKKELAERLGVQRTSLSRELNKMRKDGLILYDSRSITITNLL